jgi:hypothetical protein
MAPLLDQSVRIITSGDLDATNEDETKQESAKIERLAAPQGFEPRYPAPEAGVLPLNEGAMRLLSNEWQSRSNLGYRIVPCPDSLFALNSV